MALQKSNKLVEKFDVILADPPWNYDDKAHAGQRGVEYQYSTMTINQICNLSVGQIASDDCTLFLWVTFPQLPHAIRVMRSWGFEYKTIAFNWVKMNTKRTDTLFWGMGNWTRSNSEVCLLGVRGKPKRDAANVHSVIQAPRGRHSEKPDEVYERIETLMGPGVNKCELFARNRRPGWKIWGNELDNDFELKALSKNTLGSLKKKIRVQKNCT